MLPFRRFSQNSHPVGAKLMAKKFRRGISDKIIYPITILTLCGKPSSTNGIKRILAVHPIFWTWLNHRNCDVTSMAQRRNKDYRCLIFYWWVSSFVGVIIHPFWHESLEFFQCLGIKEKGSVFCLKTAVESFHFGVVPGSIVPCQNLWDKIGWNIKRYFSAITSISNRHKSLSISC